jgi:hypothetical protein
MTIRLHGDDNSAANDPALDALLRRADVVSHLAAPAALESRVVARAALPLAARRRDMRGRSDTARPSTADMLADWLRVAMPMAAAAAIIAVLSLSRIEATLVTDADLQNSDPAALLSAIDNNQNALAHYLIANDATDDDATAAEPR